MIFFLSVFSLTDSSGSLSLDDLLAGSLRALAQQVRWLSVVCHETSRWINPELLTPGPGNVHGL
jgi:hypothetical protein